MNPVQISSLFSLRNGLACICILIASFLFVSCGKGGQAVPSQGELTKEQLDSIRFAAEHHYTLGANFVVKSDSLMLIRQQPEEELSGLHIDSFAVGANTHLVVAEIRTISSDPVDSIWLKVATDDMQFGWNRECTLLQQLVPDAPISLFINTFSNIHVAVTAVLLLLVISLLLLTTILRRKAFIVHFHDIRSIYPTLLCIIVALGATFYATIQNFAQDAWQDFYFHPTLNPLAVEPLLGFFLLTFWAIQIVGLAVIDDVRHQLNLGDAVLYMFGLSAVCAVNYIVFSISTLYYIGYPLLVVYIIVALLLYLRKGKAKYVCGKCGAKLVDKGRCPRCGAVNE